MHNGRHLYDGGIYGLPDVLRWKCMEGRMMHSILPTLKRVGLDVALVMLLLALGWLVRDYYQVRQNVAALVQYTNEQIKKAQPQ